MTLSQERLKAISAHLREERTARMLTQEELAEKVGLSVVYYCQIESANKAPSLETLINLSEELEVSIDSLIYGHKATTAQASIMQLLRRVPEDKLVRLERVMHTMVNQLM